MPQEIDRYESGGGGGGGGGGGAISWERDHVSRPNRFVCGAGGPSANNKAEPIPI